MCKSSATTARQRNPNEGLPGGSGSIECSHREKKKLFDSKKVNKKLKTTKDAHCSKCNNKAEGEEKTATLVCVTCTEFFCMEHADEHCKASRTGERHVIFMSYGENSLRCLACECDLQPYDDGKDYVKDFICAVSAANKSRNAKSVVEEQEQNETAAEAKSRKDRRKEKHSLLDGAATSMKQSPFSRPKGLTNMGNTCYFNSACQSLFFTYAMNYYYERFGNVSKVSVPEVKTITVDDKKVTIQPAEIPVSIEERSMNDCLKSMAKDYGNGNVSPNRLLSLVANKIKMRVYQQQDSHELLRCLLDALRNEETTALKKGIATYLESQSTMKDKDNYVNSARLAKGYLEAAGRPLLDSVFGGRLQQSIECTECGHINCQLENFLDLSLCVPSDARARIRRESINQERKPRHHSRKGGKRVSFPDDQVAEQNVNLEEEEVNSDDCADGLANLDLNDEHEHKMDKEGVTEPLVPYTDTSSNARYNISYLLRLFMAEEKLSGNNKYECEKCCAPENKKKSLTGDRKKRIAAWKRYLIFEPPAVLILHLKRFSMSDNGFGRPGLRKISAHIEFPEVLDIAPFCSKSVKRIADGQDKVLYSLYAIVSHSGTMSSGHYVAYVKSRKRIPQAEMFVDVARMGCVDALSKGEATASRQRQLKTKLDELWAESFDQAETDGQWYYVSDTHVEAIKKERAISAEAYVLFYERVR